MKLTDAIFGRPLGNSVSEDHVYLEIIKHIEAGENDTCAERSWELMWLITGLYSCSDNIKDEVINFLRARTENNVLAKQCYMRLVKMITHGRRTYPPHIAEVQAIQTRMDLINHKVFFPDGSCQSFEVESSTTARHLISVITENIGLRYPSGCGLFFKIGDKVFGAADEYFFFDFIQHFIEVWRRTEGGDGIAVNYQVFFLRKVWINVIPGEDRVADCRLHYYQELSKYLRGYHKCTEAESILLATLILRAEFGEDTEHLSEIPDMLNKLVPHEMIPHKTVDEWQQVIEQALSENVTCFGDDAKIEFLKEICNRPTFGTAFFSVKTKMIDNQQEALLLAVQKNGLAFLDATDKTVMERYDFSQVEKWASGEKKITIDVKVNEERKKFEFETSLDYQIDDFLTSYISAYGSESQDVSDDI
ncbi:myosin-VIIa-like [Dendronephthya gigantea]|uniref:myosin-VIIa-like n=1 Tax=Dendronephthya gigantea TaxID=151771 RepID=UPI00106CDC5E|nr:myosin-VIIa-like [Dendronephthya gigantea]